MYILHTHTHTRTHAHTHTHTHAHTHLIPFDTLDHNISHNKLDQLEIKSVHHGNSFGVISMAEKKVYFVIRISLHLNPYLKMYARFCFRS